MEDNLQWKTTSYGDILRFRSAIYRRCGKLKFTSDWVHEKAEKEFFFMGTFNKRGKLSAKFSQNDVMINHKRIFLSENRNY